ncbi:translesion error-prone DNA polymerase V autoproteolytic subunit [Thorsellia anophelis]|uniref:DNA polymerase V n=1 Tax=Thorsellia anophelis DSM 18579 TaxID=1123402 RepID=A0A1I0F5N9_9GAMM|nr:translesion error-prone DNA polymerase V autoproteolytic subunit [Thorsellia anophelis]SET53356.1 DNA polymerase V [Thorsellia anophelis DSM 18579]
MQVKLIGQTAAHLLDENKLIILPLFLSKVSAGFPSPAQDYIEQTLDLNQLCIQHPAATFFVRVEGDSMIEVGIFQDDILTVDRSLIPKHGEIVIACVNGEFTVKELSLKPTIALIARNKKYAPIYLKDGDNLDIFGVVTNVIRRMRKQS